MSRLIVKNLPKNTTEEAIRKLFSEKGVITDIELKYTPDGKFRQFAFVGYQNEDATEEAIKHFDKMFIQTNRIKVEYCASLGDEKKPKAWSKYAPDSTAYKELHPVKVDAIHNKDHKENSKVANETSDGTKKLLAKYKNEPLFEEFLQLNAPKDAEILHRMHESTEEDDETNTIEPEQNLDNEEEEEEIEQEKDKLADQQISDLEYMKQLVKTGTDSKARTKAKKEPKNIKLFTLKLKNLPFNCRKKEIKQFFKPTTPFTIRLPPKIHGIAYVGFKNEQAYRKALLKDRSFISGKRITVGEYVQNHNKNEAETHKNSKQHAGKSQKANQGNEDDIAESGQIFIKNLAFTTTEKDVEEAFSKFGPIVEVKLPISIEKRRMRNFGIVTFLMPEHAVKAYGQLDGTILHGVVLHLYPGKRKETADDNLVESTNYKAKKAAKQKALSGSSHNWNSLFLGHDAVAEVIVDSYGTTKENILGPESGGSAAVKLALGETQIVAQTRKYLEQEGVVLDAFQPSNTKRSKTVILVKNLPSKTTEKEIRNLFEKHGELGRVIMPPSGITAIVEFFEQTHAKKAFTRLAYSKFKNTPLYLEWAPDNSLKDVKPPSHVETKQDDVESKLENEEEEEEEEPESDTTLFVKNLNFQTTDESLRKHFEGCGKIAYATVATKKDKNTPNNKLSMGYGFVRFMYKAGADKALKTLQQSVLDGKSLELKRSERTLNNEVVNVRKTSKLTKQSGTKILVRNIPFQANIKEIRELFGVFGEIKALRLPKKMSLDSNSHRGFAFVDFTTPSDAKNAFEALSQSTHLYGRRLVLEWAAPEEVEQIRKRTADHFATSQEKRSKKSVLNID